MQATRSPFKLRSLCWLAAIILPLMLAACGSGHDDDDTSVADGTEQPSDTTPETPDTRNQAYLSAKAGDVLEVRIEELHPTQDALGYDQIYYKLGRWQGDFDRPTWQDDEAEQLDYLNSTVGKKFDDYCEDNGGEERAQEFQTIEEAKAARLDDDTTFECKDALGTDADALKTVVVGWDGNLYLTDGHHTFSALREISDGGPKLNVWVKVDANYSDMTSREEFWQRMVDENKVWLRDGNNQPITVDQLPTRVGLANDTEAGGMSEDKYRSLVYFTREIGYDNGDLPEFAEFLWGDWLRSQTTAGRLNALTDYKLGAPAALADILAESTLKKDLTPDGSDDSYAALVRDAALLMSQLGDTDAVYQTRTASELGRIALVANADSDSPTKAARDTLEELVRNDVKKSGEPRNAGKLWFAVNYRLCGKPAAGTACWGW